MNHLQVVPRSHPRVHASTYRAVSGFWGGRYERSFVDVRVFNPHAPSNRNTSIPNCYRRHEAEKKRAYEQRIREVEHSSFTPLVFSATGGMGSTFYRRLATLLAEKWNESYSSTLSWIRCLLSFCLLRSAIQCIRGARSSRGHAIKSSLPIDLVSHEATATVFYFFFFCVILVHHSPTVYPIIFLPFSFTVLDCIFAAKNKLKSRR